MPPEGLKNCQNSCSDWAPVRGTHTHTTHRSNMIGCALSLNTTLGAVHICTCSFLHSSTCHGHLRQGTLHILHTRNCTYSNSSTHSMRKGTFEGKRTGWLRDPSSCRHRSRESVHGKRMLRQSLQSMAECLLRQLNHFDRAIGQAHKWDRVCQTNRARTRKGLELGIVLLKLLLTLLAQERLNCVSKDQQIWKTSISY